MAQDRGTKFIIGLVVMLAIAIVGFSLYQSITGVSKITQPIAIGLLTLSALGLMRFFIASGEKTLTFEDGISALILVVAPIAALFLLPKIGINLFSIAEPLVSAAGSFNIDFVLEGSIIDFIKNNLLLVSTGLFGLYWFVVRKK